jgi:hypothetical protein
MTVMVLPYSRASISWAPTRGEMFTIEGVGESKEGSDKDVMPVNCPWRGRLNVFLSN